MQVRIQSSANFAVWTGISRAQRGFPRAVGFGSLEITAQSQRTSPCVAVFRCASKETLRS